MKKFLSLALALVMTMSLVTISAGAKDFTDNSKITYGDAVKVMSAIEVVDGYAQGDFRPTNTLTRGAAAKIICNMVLGPTTAGALPTSVAPFKDVPAGSTFAGYIAYCSQKGIINGYADGTFRPSGTLNGYAFMKMLLGALGYDGKIEGFTGANWSVNVAKLAMGIGLDDGLTEGFNGSKAVTREEACLYAFNTLQADMVEYSTTGSSITVGGVEIVTNPSKAEPVTTNGTSNTICDERTEDGVDVDTVQFGERYFKDLEKNSNNFYDDFDRPATQWLYDDEEVTVVAEKADATFTKAVSHKDLAKAVNMVSTSDSFSVYTDGKSGSALNIDSTDDDTNVTGSGRGVLVEVYYDKKVEANNRIIVINPVVDTIDDVDTNDDDERIVEIGSLDFVTEQFEEDDVVLYTVNKDANPDEIKTMVALEKLTGELTKKVGSSKYTIDGTVYELSESTGKDINTVDVKDTVDFYLDSYGYIVKIDVAEESDKVENLALVLDSGSSRGTGWAKLLFSDGTTKSVDLTKDVADDALNGELVSFKVQDDGLYKLSDDKATTDTSSSVTYKKGNTTMNSVDLDSKTVFVYELKNSSNDKEYKVYTGYKAAPGFKGSAEITAYTASNKSAATIVFVQINDSILTSDTSKLTFVASDSSLKVVDDGDNKYYEFQAVVDGKIETLMVKDTATNLTLPLQDEVLVFESLSYNSDDVVTSVDEAEEGDGNDYISVGTSKKTSNEVLSLGGKTYAYSNDVKVFFVNDDEITEGKVGDIREDDDGNKNPYDTIMFTTNDDGEVNMIVIREK